MRRLSLLWLALVLEAGCATSVKVYRVHTLQFEEEGRPVAPDRQVGVPRVEMKDGRPHRNLAASTSAGPGEFPILCPEEYNTYLDEIFANLEASGRNHLVVFIHGGLQTAAGSLQRIAQHIECRDLSPALPPGDCLEDEHYPIFINWRSSLWSSYRDHLFAVRKGKRVRTPSKAFASAPVLWVQDSLFGLVGFVPNSFELGGELTRGWQTHKAEEEAARLHGLGLDISLGEDRRLTSQRFNDKVQWVPLGLLNGLTMPVIAGYGKPAWEIMVRRANVLFQSEVAPISELERCQSQASVYRQDGQFAPGGGDGALSEFFGRLEALQQRREPNQPRLRITLIGHSMGTIVLNKALRAFPDLAVDRIVYLAAACSLDDYQDTVFPYLKRHSGDVAAGLPPAEMFHLTLQERAEVLETHAWGAVPGGSLLVWIDNFLEDARYRLDRTAGRIANLLWELDRTPADLVGRIHVKTFDYGRQLAKEQPQTHGDFDDKRFWQDGFLYPAPAGEAADQGRRDKGGG